MGKQITFEKLKILAESAKYDVSCASSGTTRANKPGGIGSASGWGICHSFADDGRCISLLKVLLTNQCEYDCAYCVNRRSSDILRAAFGVRELADLTLAFYKRNYIEGLFISSAVLRSPDYTMERMLGVLRMLRREYRFNGYIHMKSIPGASKELVYESGLLADRLSVNIEIPSERSLKMLAPEKNYSSVYKPMLYIKQGAEQNAEDRRKYRHAPKFAPAGQSTQMIIGASAETDRDIIRLASMLYQGPALKRVYYSGYVPINSQDARLPGLKSPPLVRENRLYQADWLLRLYQFQPNEILEPEAPYLDLEIDPKLAWALRHPEYFPLDVNVSDYQQILRVPGIGLLSAKRIVTARRQRRLDETHLKKLGVVMRRAKYFLSFSGRANFSVQEAGPECLRQVLLGKREFGAPYQLSMLPSWPLAEQNGPPGGTVPVLPVASGGRFHLPAGL